MTSATLNLLPPERRDGLQGAIFRRLALFYGKAAIVALLLLSAELATLIAATRIELQALQERESAEERLHEEFLALEARAGRAANEVTAAALLLQKRMLAAPVLEQITRAVPAGIRLTRIRFAASQFSVEVTGIARTRELLLEFEHALKGLPYVRDVQIPLPSLLKAQNADFVLTVYLQPTAP